MSIVWYALNWAVRANMPFLGWDKGGSVGLEGASGIVKHVGLIEEGDGVGAETIGGEVDVGVGQGRKLSR